MRRKGINHNTAIKTRIFQRLNETADHARNCAIASLSQPFSRLYIIGDNAGWALDNDRDNVLRIAQTHGIRANPAITYHGLGRQSLFFLSRYVLHIPQLFSGSHRIAFPFYHGWKSIDTGELSEEAILLKKRHLGISRMQVTNKAMMMHILESGIAPERVHLIPIGINLRYFHAQTEESKCRARRKHKIPQMAFVIGSFHKDGMGWGEGFAPKSIKGPDIFLRAIATLRTQIPDLIILLSGPARGYVKKGLDELNVPYKHVCVSSYPEMGDLYQAIDLYMIASRDDGGPKGVLESMASGVPQVTTRVGQAADLVAHGKNGWIVEVGDSEGLAHWAQYAIEHPSVITRIATNSRQTAEANSFDAQGPLWKAFWNGFIE